MATTRFWSEQDLLDHLVREEILHDSMSKRSEIERAMDVDRERAWELRKRMEDEAARVSRSRAIKAMKETRPGCQVKPREAIQPTNHQPSNNLLLLLEDV